MELNDNNYYSIEANKEYASVSQLKQFVGYRGENPCEYKAMAEINGEYERKQSSALLMGQYVEILLLEPDKKEAFETEHPELFSSRGATKGMLKSEFSIANKMVEKCQNDEFFMRTLVGEHQKIMTGEIYGIPFKVKMDVYREGKYIVDLKTCQSIKESNYNPIIGKRQNMVEFNDYITQATIYTEIVRQNTGKILPFFLACVSKQEEPDIEVIQIDYETQEERLRQLEPYIVNLGLLKSGEVEPTKCGQCPWCIKHKKLTKAINWLELGGELD